MLHRVILFIYTILIHLFSPETRWILYFLDKLHRTGPEINMAFNVTFTIAAVQMLSIYYPPLSICLCLFSLVTGDNISCNMLGGDFKGKRIKLWLSPLADVQIYWVDWAVLVKARKQNKKNMTMRTVCVSTQGWSWPHGLDQQEEKLFLGIMCCWKVENPKLAAYVPHWGNTGGCEHIS